MEVGWAKHCPLTKLTGKIIPAQPISQYSIRINDQWRICFCFDGQDASNVEIVDYH
jgi:plasmid maintenance system killer protein